MTITVTHHLSSLRAPPTRTIPLVFLLPCTYLVLSQLYHTLAMTEDSTNPPTWARRIHASQTLIDVFKKLLWALKLPRNKDIEARNILCGVRNTEHAHNPVAHPDPVSDNESFLTVLDVPMDALTPVSRIKKLANKLFPTSACDLLMTFVSTGGTKHVCDNVEPKPATKKLKEMVEI